MGRAPYSALDKEVPAEGPDIYQNFVIPLNLPEDKWVTAIDMKPTALARMKGKPAPDWIITDARGARRDVKLSDYRGKWVYLEFWGYW